MLLKLAIGQFESAKIKVKSAKLREPPAGGWQFYGRERGIDSP